MEGGQFMDIQEFNYECDGVQHRGRLVSPGGDNLPAVLVVHDWTGVNDFAVDAASRCAEAGYMGIVLDMYGEGKTGANNDEKGALITPMMQDRSLLKKRLLAGFEAAQSIPGVNASKLAALGFCFGGLCVLDLARAGADVKGVISFHGLLDPTGLSDEKISASVLALHGNDDPMVPPEKVQAFEKEMTEAGVDWQLTAYGHTVHAFTNPAANDPSFGTVYNEKTAQRAWVSAYQFLKEVLG